MQSSTASPAAAPKRQGPIRTEAVVPFAILLALVVAYGVLFLDGHLRRGLEYVATQANGAEVNIGALEISFRNAGLEISDIQVTDPHAPSHNRVQIGTLRFFMLWDALLRGKVVVEHADVLQIGVNTPRATPGRVVPRKAGDSGVSDRVLAAFKEQISDNVLGDLAAMAEGADPREQLSKVGDNLTSRARLTELQAELTRKEAQWRQRIDALPTSETVSALQARLRAVKLDRFNNVQEVQASLHELQAIRDELDGHSKNVRGTGSALGADVNAYRTVYADLEKAIRRDIDDVQAHFGLPRLDTKSLAAALFGADLLQKVGDARGYMDQARAYMPPKRADDQKATRPIAHPRARGTDYAFGRPNAYPRFWLKQAAISSRPDGAGFAGQVSGELKDFTTEPTVLGRPMVANLSGDFPAQGVHAASAELVVDHTGDEPRERVVIKVGRYDVAARPLVTSDALTLGFERAAASGRFEGELRGEQVTLAMESDFTDVGYQIAARSPLVQEIVHGAVSGIPRVNFTARVSGTWQALDWHLATNLAAELEKAFRRQLQATIDAARARVEAMVRERIATERQKLEAQLASADGQLKAQVAARQAELDQVRTELDKRKNDLENQQRAFVKTQEQKLKNEAGKLLDGLIKR